MREITHRVQRGDTVWAIAQRYSVRPADLLKWNNLDRDAVLRPGDDLKVLLK
ncbi:MAG: LysM peptidoglycan-binding domain-containing protein [Gemmatimonadetes bacterium]|nr:LysM peptidoglycan-binding domain-containing protein [Gemmatimonadota bacterium]